MKDYANELSTILFKTTPFSSDTIKHQEINVFNIYNIYNIFSPGLIYNLCIVNNIFTVVYPFQNYEAFNFLVNFF